MCKLSHSNIFIDRMKLYAYHGVMELERIVGGEFEVSLIVDYDYSDAIATDQLTDTVNYATLCDIVKHEMTIPSRLLEHVAGRIIKAVINAYPKTKGVKVRIAKTNPPMGADCDGAGVEIEFRQ